MGIPTLNGAVWFHDDYVGNPLVFCGCVGVMPRGKVTGEPQAGDHIVAIGGRTGRDGIHGATFSSAELTDTHADEFSHAVQIGNAVTEKKLLDAILAARDHPEGCLFRAITDCGAGGFSSAVGEMGHKLGAEVHLERAPLKYAGLSPTEIWISEAQERMVLAMPPANVAALRAICELHEVEMCELGQFGTAQRALILQYDETEVGRLSMEFLHEGLPELTRQATWSPPDSYSDAMAARDEGKRRSASIEDALLALLSHPNIASKRWIIRQYDHEVQGGSVLKPLVGASAEGPSDAAVILPVAGSARGLAIANGLATGLRDDPYLMALVAIDECVRNLVCVGADPNRIALLDNFCWPSCDDPEQLGALVRAAEACYDGATAYRTPFISGKDSLNNQFTTEGGQVIRIPPTLLISGIGIVPDVGRCITMDAKAAGNLLVVVGPLTQGRMGGSHFGMLFIDAEGDGPLPEVELQVGPLAARAVHTLIERGLVCSAHDASDGGLLVAAAEMAIGGDLGLELRADDLSGSPGSETADESAQRTLRAWFCEEPSRYLLEVRPEHLDEARAVVESTPNALSLGVIGQFNTSGRLTMANDELDVDIEALKQAWLGTLDW
jgi:phosphoribosylformylglycinamidine synthase